MDPATDLARIADWLRAWDSHGPHRTATAGDDAGADWLAAEARAAGADVLEERFALHRLDPRAASVSFTGRTIQGVAMFDAPDGVIEGRAGPIGLASAIGVGDISPLAVYSHEFRTMRRTTPHRALVYATQGGAPGLALLNAESFTAPYGPPILQVASEHAAALAAAAGRGETMRVVLRAERRPAMARNVVATIRGRDLTQPPLVIMTPRSSWWTSTAERGGGLVCWLACLRAILAAPPSRDVVFTANSGHELGHIGLDAFLADRPGWERRASWMHFGANIGAAGGQLTVCSGHADSSGAMSAALTAAGQGHIVQPETAVPNGESRDIHRAGGRYVTLVAGSKLFHLPQDRLPDAVDLPAIARSADAAVRVALALSR